MIGQSDNFENLIRDGSFENVRHFPRGFTKKNMKLDILREWFQPTKGTTDSFHKRSANYQSKIPDNYFGFQAPKDGLSYVGLGAYKGGGREYICQELTMPFVKDSVYSLEFWVSLADRSKFAFDSLGIGLSKAKSSWDVVIPAYDTLLVYHGVILDTINWTKVSFNYTARGGEQYLFIGCFARSDRSLSLSGRTQKMLHEWAYYYLDQVSVRMLNNSLQPNVDQDTSVVQTMAPAVDPLQSFILPGVFFTVSESKLTRAGTEALDALLTELHNCTGCRIEVVGHTDDQGSDEFNMALSRDRAMEVAIYFESKGILRQRIFTKGIGATQPIADNTTEEGRAQNRRVEIIIHRP